MLQPPTQPILGRTSVTYRRRNLELQLQGDTRGKGIFPSEGRKLASFTAESRGPSTMLATPLAFEKASSWPVPDSQDSVEHGRAREPLLSDQAATTKARPVPDSAAPSP